MLWMRARTFAIIIIIIMIAFIAKNQHASIDHEYGRHFSVRARLQQWQNQKTKQTKKPTTYLPLK